MEQGILGCILLLPVECLCHCIEKLGETIHKICYDLRHQTILDTLVEMHQRHEAIDVITLQQRLKEKSLLEQVGGLAYLSELPNLVPSAANIDYYLDVVRDKYLLRRVIHTCTDVVDRAYDCNRCDVEKVLDEVEAEILKIRPDQKQQNTPQELVFSSMEKIDMMFAKRGQITGMETGFEELDRLTNGMQDGEMIVVAAFPSLGKSTLAGNIATLHALRGTPVGVFTFEMTPEQFMQRAIYAESHVNPYNIRDGSAGDVHFKRMTEAASKLARSPFHIENCAGYTKSQMCACIRRAHQKHGIKLGIVDYIQLVRDPSAENREQEVNAISTAIKLMAMEFGIPFIAMSQLNDDGKLARSRAIGQDADGIWQIEAKGKMEPVIQPVEIKVNKARNGMRGSVDLIFEKCYTRFVSAPKISDDDLPK
jgi:replicative DNA helicase